MKRLSYGPFMTFCFDDDAEELEPIQKQPPMFIRTTGLDFHFAQYGDTLRLLPDESNTTTEPVILSPKPSLLSTHSMSPVYFVRNGLVRYQPRILPGKAAVFANARVVNSSFPCPLPPNSTTTCSMSVAMYMLSTTLLEVLSGLSKSLMDMDDKTPMPSDGQRGPYVLSVSPLNNYLCPNFSLRPHNLGTVCYTLYRFIHAITTGMYCPDPAPFMKEVMYGLDKNGFANVCNVVVFIIRLITESAVLANRLV